jgi:hypothetical protein
VQASYHFLRSEASTYRCGTGISGASGQSFFQIVRGVGEGKNRRRLAAQRCFANCGGFDRPISLGESGEALKAIVALRLPLRLLPGWRI